MRHAWHGGREIDGHLSALTQELKQRAERGRHQLGSATTSTTSVTLDVADDIGSAQAAEAKRSLLAETVDEEAMNQGPVIVARHGCEPAFLVEVLDVAVLELFEWSTACAGRDVAHALVAQPSQQGTEYRFCPLPSASSDPLVSEELDDGLVIDRGHVELSARTPSAEPGEVSELLFQGRCRVALRLQPRGEVSQRRPEPVSE